MRIVLDTNVLIAAALKSGLAEQILELTTTNEVFLVISEDILTELKQKLLSKFDKSETNVEFFIEKIKSITKVVSPREKISVVKRDPDDNKILECAVAGNANLIISADQDLIKLKTFRGIAIIHPKTFTWILPEYFKDKK